MKRIIRKVVLGLARKLAGTQGAMIVDIKRQQSAAEGLIALVRYSRTSGHLARGFKAGKIVQRASAGILSALFLAEAEARG